MSKKHGPGGDQKWKKHGFLPDSKVKRNIFSFWVEYRKNMDCSGSKIQITK